MRRAVLFLLLLTAGCYDRHEVPAAAETEAQTNITLYELRSRYRDRPFEIEQDLRITGVVTTSDRADNFYRTFCIEQEGAAVEIMAGTDYLFNSYPIGCRVQVQLKGLAAGMQYGVLQLGRKSPAGSGYPTDYLGSPAALDRVVTRLSETLEEPFPANVFAGALSPSQCGMLVRIAGLRYMPEELEANTWAGYKRFIDAAGTPILAYTRNYARWAGDPLPLGVVTLTGILQSGPSGYILKLRDENDCTD